MDFSILYECLAFIDESKTSVLEYVFVLCEYSKAYRLEIKLYLLENEFFTSIIKKWY